MSAPTRSARRAPGADSRDSIAKSESQHCQFSASAAEIAHALNAKQVGDHWMACCVAHEDKKPSMSIAEGRHGPLVHCFAGCSQGELIEALRARGLWSGSWRARRSTPISAADRANIARQQVERQARIERAHKAAAERAAAIWAESKPADAAHQYLADKRVKPHSARQRGDRLVLSLFDFDRVLHSLQFIGPDGDKKLLREGKKRGNFIPVNGTMPAERVLIAEGFATACTLAEIEPESLVLAAVDAGNLQSVAVSARERMPGAEIVVCGDCDDVGETKARLAAVAAGALVAFPDLPPGAEGSDFNDLAVLRRAGGVL